MSRPTPSHGGTGVVAPATGQVARTLDFVNIALDDFASARSSWRSLHDEFTEKIRAAGEGIKHRLSDDENSIFERKQAAHVAAEFRIDAYYVFARILLAGTAATGPRVLRLGARSEGFASVDGRRPARAAPMRDGQRRATSPPCLSPCAPHRGAVE